MNGEPVVTYYPWLKPRIIWSGFELGYLCSCGACYPVPGIHNKRPFPAICHRCGTLRENMEKRALGVTKFRRGWLWFRRDWFEFSAGIWIDQSYQMPTRRHAKRNGFDNVVPLNAKTARHS